jgi:DNA helicase-2/ATP-dependent DNA helicase PcrA
MQRRPKSSAAQKLAAQKPAVSAPLLQLSSGDQIRHKTFGDGLVISVTPMGGDALIEVAFEQVGTKKLMLKTAGVHMTKK